jgi:hypothetical protein
VTPIPTAREVVAWLNARLEARGLAHRITHISVLPYTSPMWMANWEAPELSAVGDASIVEEELREARWRFPHVYEDG